MSISTDIEFTSTLFEEKILQMCKKHFEGHSSIGAFTDELCEELTTIVAVYLLNKYQDFDIPSLRILLLTIAEKSEELAELFSEVTKQAKELIRQEDKHE